MQLSELEKSKDEAAEFVKQDPEGSLMFDVLLIGIDNLKREVPPKDWPEGLLMTTAWMIRDLVSEAS